jgi:hypothetical protein
MRLFLILTSLAALALTVVIADTSTHIVLSSDSGNNDTEEIDGDSGVRYHARSALSVSEQTQIRAAWLARLQESTDGPTAAALNTEGIADEIAAEFGISREQIEELTTPIAVSGTQGPLYAALAARVRRQGADGLNVAPRNPEPVPLGSRAAAEAAMSGLDNREL